ncbi:uncharacterized protein METZ01_LOCUS462129 [marine metagenome]|uniref:Uncharacterized protein n=1 Tax=marine metagenome TaxID=408172 RepID=A0A383APZ6_9ZZZZ
MFNFFVELTMYVIVCQPLGVLWKGG